MSSADTLNREKILPQNWLMKENNKIDQVIDRAVDSGMQVIDRAVDGGMMAFSKFQCKGHEALNAGFDSCNDDETMSTCSGTFISEQDKKIAQGKRAQKQKIGMRCKILYSNVIHWP